MTVSITKEDIKIVLALLLFEGYNFTSTQLAKVIYDVSDRFSLQKYDARLQKRLSKLTKYGILNREVVDGRYIYTLNKDKVYLCLQLNEDLLVLYRFGDVVLPNTLVKKR